MKIERKVGNSHNAGRRCILYSDQMVFVVTAVSVINRHLSGL